MIPFVLPFVIFLVLVQIPAAFAEHYAVLYPLVVFVTGGTTVYLLRGRGVLRPHFQVAPGVIIGVLGIIVWIALCKLDLDKQLFMYLPAFLRPADRPGFNPFEAISNPIACWAFIAVRLSGLAILIPVVEELFWRGFVMRWLVDVDWHKPQAWRFTPGSFAIVTLLFVLAHPEWLAAAVYCALLNGLVYWKKDLWNCVVAHAVSNLILGIYILSTGNWQLW